MMSPNMNAIDGGNRQLRFRLKRETTGRANIPPCSGATKEGALEPLVLRTTQLNSLRQPREIVR